jgi:pyruvate-ferredoxin/flavodoxin oxidoreductase
MVRVCIDGNEAAARVAYACSDSVAIYPITPASPMGELSDSWAAAERPNLWGVTPRVVEMQSEGGAAGALHGMATEGALATTFTASQGLLLMLPNLYKLAGELTPSVVHVAARSLATHALSIFGDHSDVMSARGTGMAMLASASPQEAHDLAAVAHVATLRSRVPFLHFFDGFRTSHEINEVELVDDDDLRALIREDDVAAQRMRGLTPDAPELRGTAQNPDVFFQAREAANPFYDVLPETVQEVMDELAERTGRAYGLVDYTGAEDAERVLVLMGSGTCAATETVEEMVARGERVGVLTVRLYRPFPAEALLAALPETVTSIAVLDRTKEPGASGEPLLQDVLTVLAGAAMRGERELPRVTGGRYGLSSKEFTPAMIKGVFDDLAGEGAAHERFTVGIIDDVTHLSLPADDTFELPHAEGNVSAVFYGLGSDGTVGANKNTVKIVSEGTDLHAQGYFVYDSKKSGAVTVSHLRFSRSPVRSTYLIGDRQADVVACHQFGFFETRDVLAPLKRRGTLLLNAPYPGDQVWDRLPSEVQRDIIEREITVHTIDAYAVARETGLGGRINTVMQPAFFAVSGVLPVDEAIEAIREAVRKTYGKRGPDVVQRNLEAVDRSLASLSRLDVPDTVTSTHRRQDPLKRALELSSAEDAPDFVERVTSRIMAGEGDLLPVSAMPVDGTFPTGTTKFEKRSIAQQIPVWDPDICIDCGKCAIVCPHAAIQMKVFDPSALEGAPDSFLSKSFRDRTLDDHLLTVQVAPDDCTGCNVCVEVCPAVSKEAVGHKAIDMVDVLAPARGTADVDAPEVGPAPPEGASVETVGDDGQPTTRDVERERFAFFESIPYLDREAVRHDTVKGSQLLQPLFTYSGACAGCGETPYIKLLTQLFGDRTIIANATGCSSIYGGNLPTTPYMANSEGRGPAWSNSLFEDNAEFGLGMRVALDQRRAEAEHLLRELQSVVGEPLLDAILTADQSEEPGIEEQRGRVEDLRRRLASAPEGDVAKARRLAVLADDLVKKDVWIVGGDGWAYDIGYGGLDHVLASGEDVNILVLDTEVYSNTGGQASKATPRAAVARFAQAGKPTPKKDLGLLAMQYGDVFVAQIAMGANETQTVRALREAEAWPGPSLILAYSTCIAHGIDMKDSMAHMDLAVKTGAWPLYRFHPGEDEHAQPFKLDSRKPSKPLSELHGSEARFAMLQRTDPWRAEQLQRLAQDDVDERWRYYEQLAGVERTLPHDDTAVTEDE